jgi:hypothetical protein
MTKLESRMLSMITDDNAVYDYTNQAWIVDGVYVTCAHPATMDCLCFGKLHAGERPDATL